MIHLELQPEIEAQLTAKAHVRGLSLQKHIEQIVTGGHAKHEAEFQRLRDLAAGASAEEGIRQGLEELRTGMGRPAAEFLNEMRAKYAIPR